MSKTRIVPCFIVFNSLILVCITSCMSSDSKSSGESFPVLRGRYLGQKPPGLTPEQFAPRIIPTEGVQHCFPTFSRNGKEVYWMDYDMEARQGVIMFMRVERGYWTAPKVAPFSGEYNDHSPTFSPDSKRLYFVSNRPGGYGRGDIWYVKRMKRGWSEPVNLGSPPNSERSDLQPSFTSDGTLYFTSEYQGAQWNLGIYRSRLVDGYYTEAEALDTSINTADADYTPFIARDESYLIFASSRPGTRSVETDLYISYHLPDDSWSEPASLDTVINNGYTVTFPWMSLDGNYLFFDRFNDSTDVFYWVDSKIIKRRDE
ncbi:MAG: PD40 domain-containing protein [Fidelibacterota bacterium]|nr:MAG: PD40 domain-containing protein [Candidatus Neomarinimicrobiota bacterium]